MSNSTLHDLVDIDWLLSHLSDPNIKIIDATWHMPSSMKNVKKDFERRHIPNAVYFDIDDVSDRSNPLPHMLPSENQFSRHASELGLSNDDKIVVYDTNGGHSAAARVWWTFRVFGHDKISILDGGSLKWFKKGLPTENGVKPIEKGQFNGRYSDSLVASISDVERNLSQKTVQIVDGRSSGRFNGTAPEPRIELPSGHIPNSINIPVLNFFKEADDMTLKSKKEIKALFLNSKVNLNESIITTCGSGVTASALCFCLFLIGHKKASVYDGSWTEWASKSITET